jgi:dienelactone hydrolase
MKTSNLIYLLSIILILPLTFSSCSENKAPEDSGIAEDTTEVEEPVVMMHEEVLYFDGEDSLIGHLYYKSDAVSNPGILVVHEWWGNTEYPKKRAEMLAEMGYVAFTVDMYGNGLVVDNPTDAQAESGKIYGDTALLKSRMMAAREALSKSLKVNNEKIAAIGYCFGGTVVLNAANMGVPLNAVVSFHGGLNGFDAKDDMTYTSALVCHGAADQFVPQKDVDHFKSGMDAVNAPYTFIAYDSSTHAFTNPDATATGEKFNLPIAYNAAADKKSWQDMQDFFQLNFPITE